MLFIAFLVFLLIWKLLDIVSLYVLTKNIPLTKDEVLNVKK